MKIKRLKIIQKHLFIALFIIFLYQSRARAQHLDINLLRDLNLGRNEYYDNAHKVLSKSVTPMVLAGPLIVYSIGMLHKNCSQKQKGLYVAETILGATILSAGLKYSFGRERPFISYPDIDNLMNPTSPSFPSGHTTKAFALATSISWAFPKWYVVFPAFAWAGAVGYSRIHLGVHYPSDVLMGAIVGTGSAFLSHQLNRWINTKTKKKLLFDGIE